MSLVAPRAEALHIVRHAARGDSDRAVDPRAAAASSCGSLAHQIALSATVSRLFRDAVRQAFA